MALVVVVLGHVKMYCMMSEVRDSVIGDRCVSLSPPEKQISDSDGVCPSELSSSIQLLPMETNTASIYLPPPHVS